MSLYDMAAFRRWLRQASERELRARRDQAINGLGQMTDPNVRRTCRWLIRMIEEEIMSRRLRV